MKCCSGARMAKNTTVPITGVTAKLWLCIGAFATKRKFLVIDMPEYDVVLGLDFLSKHDQIVHWHKRTMSVNVIGNNVTLHSPSATPDDGPPRWGGALRVPAEAGGDYGVEWLSPPVYCSWASQRALAALAERIW